MKAYALTDIGKTRKVNQDAQFASTEPVGELSNLFVVADGMGGHQAGDFASRYLIEHMPEYIKDGLPLPELSEYDTVSVSDGCVIHS